MVAGHTCACPLMGLLAAATQDSPSLLMAAASAAFAVLALACIRLWTNPLTVAMAVPRAHAYMCPLMGLLAVVTQACPGLLVVVVAAAAAAGARSTPHSLPWAPMPRALWWWLPQPHLQV